MVFEHVEKLQREYTDKYVEIDSDRPELARFRGVPGQVKTINMSGRALVEFMDYHLNIGWYDIEVDYLKVIDKPEPAAKEAKKKPAAKVAQPKSDAPAGEKKLSPLELARMQGAAGKKSEADEKKPSTADILEAARSKKKADEPAKPAGKMSTADILAAARKSKGEAPAEEPSATEPPEEKVEAAADRSKMSTADILAAARKSKEAAAPDLPAEEPEDLDEEVAVGEPTLHDAPDEPAAATPAGKLDKSSMSIDDMVAYCREHDAE